MWCVIWYKNISFCIKWFPIFISTLIIIFIWKYDTAASDPQRETSICLFFRLWGWDYYAWHFCYGNIFIKFLNRCHYDLDILRNSASRDGKIGLLYVITSQRIFTLQKRHNERDGVSNHRRFDCWLSRLFRHRSKKTSRLRVTGLCGGNSPVTGEFPTQSGKCFRLMTSSWFNHICCLPLVSSDLAIGLHGMMKAMTRDAL